MELLFLRFFMKRLFLLLLLAFSVQIFAYSQSNMETIIVAQADCSQYEDDDGAWVNCRKYNERKAKERADIEARDREYQRQQTQNEISTEVGSGIAALALFEWVVNMDPWPGFVASAVIVLLCVFVVPVIFPPAAFVTFIAAPIFGIIGVIDFFRGVYHLFVD